MGSTAVGAGVLRMMMVMGGGNWRGVYLKILYYRLALDTVDGQLNWPKLE